LTNLKLKKRRVLEIHAIVEQFGKEKLDVCFAYALAKNKALLEKEVTALRTAGKWLDDFAEYDKQRLDLCRLHAKKDENNLPMAKMNMFIIADQVKFDKELDEIRKKYKKAITEQEKRDKDLEKILDEEVEVEFFPIRFSCLPKEIGQDVMTILLPLVVEETG